MLIFALDSSAVVATVALYRDKTPLASFTLKNGNTHSETLLPMAKALFDVTGYTPDDVDIFACSEGPGSFTGVRIGAATVKGLAFGKNKTVIGVSTLEAMARNLLPAKGLICPVMNARRGQVYNALFYVNQGVVTRQTPDRAIALEDLKNELKNLEKPVFLVGDGSILCYNTLQEAVPNLVLPPEGRMHQRAVGVGLAALSQAGPDNAAGLSPNYLRLSQAERERNEKLQSN